MDVATSVTANTMAEAWKVDLGSAVVVWEADTVPVSADGFDEPKYRRPRAL